MPRVDVLRQDLYDMCILLQEATRAKRDLDAAGWEVVSDTSPRQPRQDLRDPVFETGTDRTTTSLLPERLMKRSLRHEGGLSRYGEWLQTRGFRPATKVYPRDFIILGTPEWLGEYKVVYGLDVVRATREAHSQLKEYSYFRYCTAKPGLLAVFSAPIGDRRVDWLNAEGIAVVWEQDRKWHGCSIARSAGLAQ